MDIIKGMLVLVLCAAVMFTAALAELPASADGEPTAVDTAAEADTDKPLFDLSGCKAAAVYECSTGTMLAGQNEHEAFSAGHFSKLMAALIAAEEIEQGRLGLEEEAVCSKTANAQKDPQIWLDYGEKIKVDELLKSICIGNANDAEVVLCEKMSKSAKSFTDILDCKVNELAMHDSHIEPISGYPRLSRISAADTAKLCSELVKYDALTEYFTTWMDTVRNGKAELVSRNRMIRSYKGMKGFKVFFNEGVGYCAAVCAARGNMTVCAVIIGSEDEDAMLSKCRSLLDTAFSAYELFVPEVPEEAIPEMKLGHGEKTTFRTDVPHLRPAVIRRGRHKEIKCTYELCPEQEAPIFAGTPVGRISFTLDGETVTSADICSAEQINEVSFLFNVKRVLANLLNL